MRLVKYKNKNYKKLQDGGSIPMYSSFVPNFIQNQYDYKEYKPESQLKGFAGLDKSKLNDILKEGHSNEVADIYDTLLVIDNKLKSMSPLELVSTEGKRLLTQANDLISGRYTSELKESRARTALAEENIKAKNITGDLAYSNDGKVFVYDNSSKQIAIKDYNKLTNNDYPLTASQLASSLDMDEQFKNRDSFKKEAQAALSSMMGQQDFIKSVNDFTNNLGNDEREEIRQYLQLNSSSNSNLSQVLGNYITQVKRKDPNANFSSNLEQLMSGATSFINTLPKSMKNYLTLQAKKAGSVTTQEINDFITNKIISKAFNVKSKTSTKDELSESFDAGATNFGFGENKKLQYGEYLSAGAFSNPKTQPITIGNDKITVLAQPITSYSPSYTSEGKVLPLPKDNILNQLFNASEKGVYAGNLKININASNIDGSSYIGGNRIIPTSGLQSEIVPVRIEQDAIGPTKFIPDYELYIKQNAVIKEYTSKKLEIENSSSDDNVKNARLKALNKSYSEKLGSNVMLIPAFVQSAIVAVDDDYIGNKDANVDKLNKTYFNKVDPKKYQNITMVPQTFGDDDLYETKLFYLQPSYEGLSIIDRNVHSTSLPRVSSQAYDAQTIYQKNEAPSPTGSSYDQLFNQK